MRMRKKSVGNSMQSVVPEEFLKFAAAAVWLPVEVVKRWAKNPRNNEAAVAPVMRSIQTFGFVAPICIWTSARDTPGSPPTRGSW